MMTRAKIISLILKNSELFTKIDLLNYSNDELHTTSRTLFLSIRTKQSEKKKTECFKKIYKHI